MTPFVATPFRRPFSPPIVPHRSLARKVLGSAAVIASAGPLDDRLLPLYRTVVTAGCEGVRRDDRIDEAMPRNARMRTLQMRSCAKNPVLQQGVDNRFETANLCVR
jgi:hypothetical protein